MNDSSQSYLELESIYQRANIYIRIARYDLAEAVVKTALDDYGSIPNLHVLLGTIYHRQSKFQEATDHFHRAWQMNPAFVDGALSLISTLCDLGRYDEADSVYQEMIQKVFVHRKDAPNTVLGRIAHEHLKTANLYEAAKQYEQALLECRRALDIFPAMMEGKLKLGLLYWKMDHSDRAVSTLETLIREYPDYGLAHLWLGLFYFKLGKVDDAKVSWTKANATELNHPCVAGYLKLWQEKVVNPKY